MKTKDESYYVLKYSRLNKPAEYSVICPDFEVGKILTTALSSDYHFTNVRLEYIEVLRFD